MSAFDTHILYCIIAMFMILQYFDVLCIILCDNLYYFSYENTTLHSYYFHALCFGSFGRFVNGLVDRIVV